MLKNKKKKGFTLIELIVVIAILGILAAVLIPRFGGFTDKGRSAQAMVDGKQIATALDGLLAEDNSKAYTEAEIMAIADNEGDIQGRDDYNFTPPAAAGGRDFTLVETIGGTTFTVTRDNTGKLTVNY